MLMSSQRSSGRCGTGRGRRRRSFVCFGVGGGGAGSVAVVGGLEGGERN